MLLAQETSLSGSLSAKFSYATWRSIQIAPSSNGGLPHSSSVILELFSLSIRQCVFPSRYGSEVDDKKEFGIVTPIDAILAPSFANSENCVQTPIFLIDVYKRQGLHSS